MTNMANRKVKRSRVCFSSDKFFGFGITVLVVRGKTTALVMSVAVASRNGF